MPNPRLKVEKPSEVEFTLIRSLAAPRARVFAAWTDPRLLSRWWGPKGFSDPVCEVDARPGGLYRIVMRSPDGVEYPLRGVFREVVPPERLVLTQELNGQPAEWVALYNLTARRARGTPVPEFLLTALFSDEGKGTRLSITTRLPTRADRDAVLGMNAPEGWGESLDRLEEMLLY